MMINHRLTPHFHHERKMMKKTFVFSRSYPRNR